MRHRSIYLGLSVACLMAGIVLGLYGLRRQVANFRELGDFDGVLRIPASVLPLRISENGRYLEDQRGMPFLVVGDSAWSLIAQPSTQDIDFYLSDREKKGYNSIIVNLIEHKFCDAPPATSAGLSPFDKPGDFRTPNESYFDFAHSVVKKANDRGIVVWLAPAYLGYRGGDQGWFQEIKRNGNAALRAYGRYIGERFLDLPNIVWVVGGDYTPPLEDRWAVTEIAEGIRERDKVHLMTAHGSPGESVVDAFGQAPWLEINNTYSYDKSVFVPLLKEYQRRPIRPFVLIESTYENEHNSSPEQIRRQAYWAMLSGACGQFMGNSPTWHFDGPGVFKQNVTWQAALDQRGSWDMIRLRNVLVGRPWYRLIPDDEHAVLVSGRGGAEATATAAATADGKLALAYIPSSGQSARQITVSLDGFSGSVTARWYNPTNGRHSAIGGSPFPNRGQHELKTPGENGTRTNDWLLILEAD